MLLNYYFGPGMARGGASLAQQQTFIVVLVVSYTLQRRKDLGPGQLAVQKR